MNEALADVQLKEIVNHELLTGVRVLDADEIRALIDSELASMAEKEKHSVSDKEFETVKTIAETMEFIRSSVSEVASQYSIASAIMRQLETNYSTLLTDLEKLKKQPNESNRLAIRRDAARVVSAYYRLITTCDNIDDYLEKDQTLYENAMATGEVLPDIQAEMSAFIEEVLSYTEKVASGEDYTGESFTGTGYRALAKSAYDLAIEAVSAYYTEEEVRAYATIPSADNGGDDDDDADDDDPTEDTSLLTAYGSIVAVTYGERDENGITVYKVFLLNYNNFAVKVEYNGVTYSIPGQEYVIIRAD